MTTRMDKVAADVALAVLEKAALTTDHSHTLIQAFTAKWPLIDSPKPINHAIRLAAQEASSYKGESMGTWTTRLSVMAKAAALETASGYINSALGSFKQGNLLDAAETLTDAVRAILGYIASTRDWPHRTDDDLYKICAALGSGHDWPVTTEQHEHALDNRTDDGHTLTTVLGAALGLPDSITSGTYTHDPLWAEENGLLFATTTIDLSTRLAAQAHP